jgi:hypothetical protein
MTNPEDSARDAAARARQDPVLFGPDPFAGRPGEPFTGQPADGETPTYGPRPRWPVAAGILILVVLLVVALGIWVL